MTRTVPIEEFPADSQRISQKSPASGIPVILSDSSEPFDERLAYDAASQDFEQETPEEIAEIEAIAEQAHADCAVGRYVTFDAVKARYAGFLSAA